MCTDKGAFLALWGLGVLAMSAQQHSPSLQGDEEAKLLAVKRVCMGNVAGDESLVAPARELAVASLFSAKRFTVTENCDKADGVIKGAVLERREKKVRGEAEEAGFGVAGGAVHVGPGGGGGGFGAAGGSSGETLYSSETRTQATVTLRMVDREGTVIWAYSQDSPGGKTKGAVADAVERVIRQLVKDIERAQPKPPGR